MTLLEQRLSSTGIEVQGGRDIPMGQLSLCNLQNTDANTSASISKVRVPKLVALRFQDLTSCLAIPGSVITGNQHEANQNVFVMVQKMCHGHDSPHQPNKGGI